MRERNLSRSLFRALLLFAAGVAVGILTAPKTGRGARAWLGQKADHTRSTAMNLTDRLRAEAKYQQGKMTGRMHKMEQLTLVPGEGEAYVDDDQITQRVRTKIGENPRTRHMPRINVDTADRIVTLRGRVQAEAERQALEDIALADPDVQEVVNKVTVARRRAAS
ncbi:MAG: BON domain-containing protein [Actinomycetota bacterium]|nr:BON domain-containing protein [Actinomycetota bacterium]